MKWVWFGQRIVPASEALVRGSAQGFLCGQGLFETMRCYNSRVFALDKHIRRLIQSCPVFDLEPPSAERLKQAVGAVIQKNHLKESCIRLNLFKRPSGVCLFVFARRLSVPPMVKYKEGFSIAVFRDEKIGDSVLNNVKSLNHYFYMRLSNRARQRGFDEALFLNSAGHIVEGSRTNVFFVKDRKVSTPEVSCGCLPGVTRAVVIELAKRLKVRIVERKIQPAELKEQDEVFVTNSLIGVMPVTRLDKRPVGSGKPSELTLRLACAYQEEVEKECLLR